MTIIDLLNNMNNISTKLRYKTDIAFQLSYINKYNGADLANACTNFHKVS